MTHSLPAFWVGPRIATRVGSQLRPGLRSAASLTQLVLSLWLAGFLAACQSAPERSIPDPLPETLAWALPEVDTSAFLGLEVRENDSGSLESLSFDPGVRVHSVIERSPAMGAGIQVDDIVLSFDGTELAAPADLDALLAEAQSGQRASLAVQRGDTVFDVEVTLAGEGQLDGPSQPTASEAFVLDPARTRAAWGTNDGAVLVSRAEDGPVGDLPLGTRVIALDDQRIVSGRGLVRRLLSRSPGEKVELEFVVPKRKSSQSAKIKLQDEGRRLTRFSVPVLATYEGAADRTQESFVLLDLYLISLFRYEREGAEKSWRFLRFFHWSSGVGALES
ncbi:MAG: PDZ domain-containing protein [Planctomycetota bacterium]